MPIASEEVQTTSDDSMQISSGDALEMHLDPVENQVAVTEETVTTSAEEEVKECFHLAILWTEDKS